VTKAGFIDKEDIWLSGVNLPWSLLLAGAIAIVMMFSQLTLGSEGGLADAEHLIGSLVLTVQAISVAKVARAVRFMLIPLWLGLVGTAFLRHPNGVLGIVNILLGIALIMLSWERSALKSSYGKWDRLIR